jgi:peroxiredoxin
MENITMLSRFRIPLRRLPRLAAELVLVLVLVLALERFLTRDAAHGPAPPLAAPLIDGRPFDLASLRGHPTVVYFWATWCPVCAAQASALDSILTDTAGITVAMRSGDAAALRVYLGKEGHHWPTLADADGSIARAWGISGVPAVFVIDAKGRIRFVTRGYTTALGLRARLWWSQFYWP